MMKRAKSVNLTDSGHTENYEGDEEGEEDEFD